MFQFFSTVCLWASICTLESIQQLCFETQALSPPSPTTRAGLGNDDILHKGSWRTVITQVYPGLEYIHSVLATNQDEQWWDLDMEKSRGYILCQSQNLLSKRKKKKTNSIEWASKNTSWVFSTYKGSSSSRLFGFWLIPTLNEKDLLTSQNSGRKAFALTVFLLYVVKILKLWHSTMTHGLGEVLMN